jgi:hypothetical protein
VRRYDNLNIKENCSNVSEINQQENAEARKKEIGF